MKNILISLLMATVSSGVFAGVTLDALNASKDGKSTLAVMCKAFTDTDISALPAATDDIIAWMNEKQVAIKQKRSIGQVVYKEVMKDLSGEHQDYRLAEVKRCYFGVKNNVSLAPAMPKAEEEPYNERGDSGRWRLMVGGAYVSGLEASNPDGKADDATFGFSIDAMENLVESDYWNFWWGIGLSYMPSRDLGSTSTSSTTSYGTVFTDTTDYEASMFEFRVMLNPEWRVTEYWTLGALAGFAIDRVEFEAKEHASAVNPVYPFMNQARSASVSEDDVYLTGIFGVQTAYRITEHFGLYANATYRTSHDFTAKKNLTNGEHKLEVGGLNVGAGLFTEF